MKLSFWSKVIFYIHLTYYNLISPLECQNYRLKVFTNEFKFLFYTFAGYNKLSSDYTGKITLKTKFGNFLIRDMCWDIKVASPSFERIDLDELIKRIDMSLQEGNRVVFFDIGAQFGKYTVALAHRFKKYANKLKIYSFEPDPECFQLLQSNIRLNKLTNIKAVRSALSDKAGIQKFYYYKPQRMIVSFRTDQIIQIRTTTLDTFVKKISNLNKSELYIKLDVEGHEMKALKGAKNTINKATNSFLMIEDFSSNARKLIPYLSAHGVMLVKNSPMNSFWKLVS